MPEPFRIVVVDDSATAQAAVAAAVEADGRFALVGRAADGAGALALVRAEAPDVALIDVVMPDMSGADVVTRLRAEGARTTFVLMSTLSEPELALRSALSGAASFVDKGRGPGFIVEVALAMARRWDGVR